MWIRMLICMVLLGILLALPFYFRKEETETFFAAGSDVDTVVVICAHNKTVRDEYERAFAKWYKERNGRDIRIDFRTPGGTSDITRYIDDRFHAEFRYLLEKEGIPWDVEYGDIFCDSRQQEHWIRKKFITSEVGIGIDVFAGGGTYEHNRMADCGYAVDGKIEKEYFEYIPAEFGGDKLYHPEGKYYGVVLSTFGIFYNSDRISQLAVKNPPRIWADLAEPQFFNTLVLADPTKSGSANKCYEIIIQQCMADAGDPAAGWRNGLNLLKRIFANGRAITDSASKVVSDIGSGNAAAGMAIDTYGFTEELWSSHRFGGSKVVYVMPKGGTAAGTDPVQILRGAPNRHAAEEFVRFLLSEDGQKLHAFRAGTPGGPEKNTLSRAPVRQDMYKKEYQQYFFKPDYNPYAPENSFDYDPRLTGRYYSLLRQVIKCLMLDPHSEMQRAWEAIITAGGAEKVPQAMAKFNALPFEYNDASDAAKAVKISKDNPAPAVAAKMREWSECARANYREAEKLAKEGK